MPSSIASSSAAVRPCVGVDGSLRRTAKGVGVGAGGAGAVEQPRSSAVRAVDSQRLLIAPAPIIAPSVVPSITTFSRGDGAAMAPRAAHWGWLS